MKERFKIFGFPIAPCVELKLNMGAEELHGPGASEGCEMPSGQEWVHEWNGLLLTVSAGALD